MFPLVGYILLFVAVGAGFIIVNLLVGKLIRPSRPQAEKATIYECGEPTIGSAWVQFDLRFYVVALLFVIFDVEVAFFFPWADVFGKANAVANQEELPQGESLATYNERAAALGLAKVDVKANAEEISKLVKANAEAGSKLGWFALWDILVFFGVLLVGFAYLWKRGDLQWVRSVTSETAAPLRTVQKTTPQMAGSGS
jgi:NADH-quinone oxidoreductase subunit A